MTGTLVEPSDQTTATPIVVPGGAVCAVPPQVAKLINPSGSAALYVFATEAIIPYNGHLLTFRPNVGYALDTALKTFLTKNSITYTAV